MIEVISTFLGLVFVGGLFYGAAEIVMDKQKAYKKRNLEENDSSRNI
tara:strand:+ start:1451 stop:1591 length:141 start_codon:yes stop_codon:yes gene_type:complete